MKKCNHCGYEHNLKGNQCRVCKDGLYRYGLDRKAQIALFENQDQKCKLCYKPLKMHNGSSYKSGNVDHNHSTKKIRGILCHECNTFIGYLEDNIEFEDLRKYLGVG